MANGNDNIPSSVEESTVESTAANVMQEPTPPDGKEMLVDFFHAKYYQNVDRGDLRSKILGDPKVFERALMLYYDESDYKRDRDYVTFRTQFLKKYGHPFGNDTLIPQNVDVTPENVQDE